MATEDDIITLEQEDVNQIAASSNRSYEEVVNAIEAVGGRVNSPYSAARFEQLGQETIEGASQGVSSLVSGVMGMAGEVGDSFARNPINPPMAIMDLGKKAYEGLKEHREMIAPTVAGLGSAALGVFSGGIGGVASFPLGQIGARKLNEWFGLTEPPESEYKQLIADTTMGVLGDAAPVAIKGIKKGGSKLSGGAQSVARKAFDRPSITEAEIAQANSRTALPEITGEKFTLGKEGAIADDLVKATDTVVGDRLFQNISPDQAPQKVFLDAQTEIARNLEAATIDKASLLKQGDDLGRFVKATDPEAELFFITEKGGKPAPVKFLDYIHEQTGGPSIPLQTLPQAVQVLLSRFKEGMKNGMSLFEAEQLRRKAYDGLESLKAFDANQEKAAFLDPSRVAEKTIEKQLYSSLVDTLTAKITEQIDPVAPGKYLALNKKVHDYLNLQKAFGSPDGELGTIENRFGNIRTKPFNEGFSKGEGIVPQGAGIDITRPGSLLAKGADAVLGDATGARVLTKSAQAQADIIRKVQNLVRIRNNELPVVSRSWETVSSNPKMMGTFANNLVRLGIFTSPRDFLAIPDKDKKALHEQLARQGLGVEPPASGYSSEINGKIKDPFERDMAIMEGLNSPDPATRALNVGPLAYDGSIKIQTPAISMVEEQNQMSIDPEMFGNALSESITLSPNDYFYKSTSAESQVEKMNQAILGKDFERSGY